jgi:protein O-GlcNAc transferase
MNRQQRRAAASQGHPVDAADHAQSAKISALFAAAIAHHRSRRLAEAEKLYREILAIDPDHADANHYLGALAFQVGRSDVAAAFISKAISRRNDDPAMHSNLGNALKGLGRLDDALASYRHAIALRGDFADAHCNLGIVLKERGELNEAIASYRRALAIKPDYVAAHNNLGNALRDGGKLDEAAQSYRRAIALKADFADAHSNLGNVLADRNELDSALESYRRALALNPDFVDAHRNLGDALRRLDRLDEAAASYARALALNPNFAEAHNNLGVTLKDRGKFPEAIASLRRAIAIKPNYLEAHNNLGNVFRDQGALDEAAASYRRALTIEPDYVEALNNLGTALGDQARFDEAIESFARVLALKPDFAEAHNNLANVLKHQGRLEEALESYERVVALRPDFAGAHSNLLLTQHYSDRISSAELYAAARRFGDKFSRRPAEASFSNDPSPARRLRIGYVSGDFQQHPVGFLLARVLEAHDRTGFEIFCYANSVNVDHVTERLKRAADHWRGIVGLSDADCAAMIQRDRIDILVDLSGHSAKNRLPMFALRPAPVQASWLGYFGTTGLPAMDYSLMDNAAAPPGEERWFTEAVVRLPYGRFCYAPPGYAPDPVDPPSLKRGYATFGSFNNVAKIGAGVVELWAQVLRATPNSRLLLKWKSLDNEGVRNRLAGTFQAAGVARERLELRGFSPHLEMLAQYGDIDVALDPFPFGGGLTSCEALWMGVPVTTMPGDRPASRQTVGFLDLLGLGGCAARSPAEYVRCATELAADPGRLTTLRHSLRSLMTKSPLCDGALFTPTLEAAFGAMWNRWRAGESPAALEIRAADAKGAAEAA